MRTDLFDFDLPDDLIALSPVEPRDQSRLLVVEPDAAGEAAPPRLSDQRIADLPDLLRPGDCLVLNDTRVIPAALEGTRETVRSEGGPVSKPRIDVNLHRRTGPAVWRAFARPAKRLRSGDTIAFRGASDDLRARVSEKADGGEVELTFDHSGAELDAAIAAVGHMPLPPYIAAKRAAEATDARDYQTVFAARDGAVAAPTAGLHFTPSLLAALEGRGIERVIVTLHVGAGTFLPVKAEDTADHRMHAEWGEVSAAAAESLNCVRQAGGRICCVGTTSLRLLETAADDDGQLAPFAGETEIFITPGYRFRAADILLTNFHLPRSTLFMLVSAFAGLEPMKAAYAHAVQHRYRFYSYGDATLLFPSAEARAR